MKLNVPLILAVLFTFSTGIRVRADEPPAAEAARPGATVEVAATPPQGEAESDADPDTAADAAGPAEVETLPIDEQRAALTPELAELRDRVRACLGYYYHQIEDVGNRSPWGVMHTLIAYGAETEVLVDGRRINAIGWLCWNGHCAGQRLFYASRDGSLQARLGPGVQGHDGQFLAMLAQSRIRSDYTIKAGGREFTIKDLVAHEQQTCEEGTELTFKLIGLVHYLDCDARWENQYGQQWDIPKIIHEELDQSVLRGTCGGTHRMMGFSYAVRKREQRGGAIDGEWLRAKKYVDSYHDFVFKLQNEDGSFSTRFFRGPGDSPDVDLRLETTGHLLEWLAFSLPVEQLSEPRMVQAVDYLTTLMLDHQGRSWEIGPRGHALHALAIYDERVFGSKPGQRDFLLVGPPPRESPSTVAPPPAETRAVPTPRDARMRRRFRR